MLEGNPESASWAVIEILRPQTLVPRAETSGPFTVPFLLVNQVTQFEQLLVFTEVAELRHFENRIRLRCDDTPFTNFLVERL